MNRRRECCTTMVTRRVSNDAACAEKGNSQWYLTCPVPSATFAQNFLHLLFDERSRPECLERGLVSSQRRKRKEQTERGCRKYACFDQSEGLLRAPACCFGEFFSDRHSKRLPSLFPTALSSARRRHHSASQPSHHARS